MALVPPTSKGLTSVQQVMLTAWAACLGESLPLVAAGASVAPSSGRIYTGLIGVNAGVAITNVQVCVQQVGSGTVPTNIAVGIADTSGTVLAVSGELKASAIWTAAVGVVNAALSAVYTPSADGAVQAFYIQVGTFGTQNLQLQAITLGVGPASLLAAGGVRRVGNSATGQSVPVVSGALPTISGSGGPPWLGLS